MYNGWNNEHPGGQQVSNVSPKVFMLLHATVMTRIRYIDDDRPFIVLTETKFSQSLRSTGRPTLESLSYI